MVVFNTDQRSRDYSRDRQVLPARAMRTTALTVKYGFRDYRGGGRSSGRETIGRVAAGAVAAQLLKELGITALRLHSLHRTRNDPQLCTQDEIANNCPVHAGSRRPPGRRNNGWNPACSRRTPPAASIECVVHGMIPAGIGDPVFDKLDANLARAITVHRRRQRVLRSVTVLPLPSSTGARNNNDAFTYGRTGPHHEALQPCRRRFWAASATEVTSSCGRLSNPLPPSLPRRKPSPVPENPQRL